ncbi:hypothetical protein BU24DRAFT_189638 [Aaosphaeria arxii CBS 175.79]|uniref:Uncharacterized protein n=1 Tax=Aaosphaeria arxii CBS 175.79 TaxID=1450172 RepID=A0A6A5XTE4_9PLEO|nr:uncharacterized protein BU24DRAFT_189638 [Aaosphaeria arxii CBS 175.79]KAF2015991.1 hypothetical protein BU24DRAFT_189638 [Aaosphaeria arxii CBS 175.79]
MEDCTGTCFLFFFIFDYLFIVFLHVFLLSFRWAFWIQRLSSILAFDCFSLLSCHPVFGAVRSWLSCYHDHQATTNDRRTATTTTRGAEAGDAIPGSIAADDWVHRVCTSRIIG